MQRTDISELRNMWKSNSSSTSIKEKRPHGCQAKNPARWALSAPIWPWEDSLKPNYLQNKLCERVVRKMNFRIRPLKLATLTVFWLKMKS